MSNTAGIVGVGDMGGRMAARLLAVLFQLFRSP
jgi:3-hydroxyisobutyrate dehydrogenase-like beta-hydroxyacid dehydrogenase